MGSWTQEDWNVISSIRPGAKVTELLKQFKHQVKVERDQDVAELINSDGESVCTLYLESAQPDIVTGLAVSDPEVVIDGVRCDQTFDELRVRFPDLRRDWSDVGRDLKAESDLDSYTAKRDEKTLWNLIFEEETLILASIFESDEDPLPRDPYIEDPNFKLVVLQALLDQGKVELPIELAFDEDDLDDLSEDEAAEVYANGVLERWLACVSIPMQREWLEDIEHLNIDAGNGIYAFIDPEFDGTSTDFDIMDLDGISFLKHLKTLEINGLCENVSIRPLKSMKSLQHITFSEACFKHFDVLKTLPSLKIIEGWFDDIYEEDAAMLEVIESSGVKVVMYEEE